MPLTNPTGMPLSIHDRPYISITHPWPAKKLTSTPGGPRRHLAAIPRTGTLPQFFLHCTQYTHPDVHGANSHRDTERGLSIY